MSKLVVVLLLVLAACGENFSTKPNADAPATGTYSANVKLQNTDCDKAIVPISPFIGGITFQVMTTNDLYYAAWPAAPNLVPSWVQMLFNASNIEMVFPTSPDGVVDQDDRDNCPLSQTTTIDLDAKSLSGTMTYDIKLSSCAAHPASTCSADYPVQFVPVSP